jgi:hypothetical protein
MIAPCSFAKWGLGLGIPLFVLLAVWTLQRGKEPSALEMQRAPEAADPGGEFTASNLRGLEVELGGREVLAAVRASDGRSQPAAQEASPRNTEPLSGRVTLLSGDPLPNVVVYATSTVLSADGIKISAMAYTDRNGSFQYTGLQSGSYSLAVTTNMNSSWDWKLPIQGHEIFKTGSQPAVLAVDAVVVKVQSPGQKERKHMPDSFRCFHAPTGEIADEAHRSRVQMAHLKRGTPDEGFDLKSFLKDSLDNAAWSPFATEVSGPWTSHAAFILPTTSAFSFRSESSVSPNSLSWTPPRKYFGTLQAGQPSGFMMLKLTDATPDLCTVILRIDQPRLPDAARLSLRQTSFDGAVYLPRAHEYAAAKLGFMELTIKDLMPGQYVFSLVLRNAGLVQLLDKKIDLELLAGTTEVRDLSTREWSLLHVKAITASPVARQTFAKVEIQHPGTAQWQPIPLHSREIYPGGSRTQLRSAVRVGGPAGASEALLPGEYRLRVTLPGYRPQDQAAPQGPGETNTFTFDLQAQ